MTDVKKSLLLISAGVVAITALHLTYNVDWSDIRNAGLPPDKRKLNVAYIPVT